jgi:hypothetical protein
MSRRTPNALADLDELIIDITVDAYGDDEPQTAITARTKSPRMLAVVAPSVSCSS